MRFSGHETFVCKQTWLKKGYDFLIHGESFSKETAVIDLGVGKNMVSSIGYWMKAFGLCNERWELTDISNYIFGQNGKDQYLEDYGTLWLLLYNLIKTGYASIYNIFFNQYREYNALEFSEEQLHSYLKSLMEKENIYNQKTLNSDISVFRRMFLAPKDQQEEIEDLYTTIFSELNIIYMLPIARKKEKEENNKSEVKKYDISSKAKIGLPYEIILYAILDQNEAKNSLSLDFNELWNGNNSPGKTFSLSKEDLYKYLEEIEENYSGIIFSSTAGIQTLQFNKQFDKWQVLSNYYDK
ncbi:hypothetical protein GGR21_000658 [Dysgonomonas hofstadii]|uniref:DUF4007 domain-containing protein n=1 Tax=Dysgonomonas hofstadii TaxID=637886 RepID=A0A840CHT1_9BACT|nr:DUF4007 family protein [Dysgonomonas hofstadii]MBB4034771.1 hypothetical protein [Dysgonomonas hofstadii]